VQTHKSIGLIYDSDLEDHTSTWHWKRKEKMGVGYLESWVRKRGLRDRIYHQALMKRTDERQ